MGPATTTATAFTVDGWRLAALARAAAPLLRSVHLPALHHMRLDGSTATVSNIDVTVRVDGCGEDAPGVLVPVRDARDAAKACGATRTRAATVMVGVDGGGFVLASEKGGTLAGDVGPLEEWPAFALPGPTGYGLPREVADAMLAVAEFTGTDRARSPILGHVVWTEHDGAGAVVATDSYRLAVADVHHAPYDMVGPVQVHRDVIGAAATLAKALGPCTGGRYDADTVTLEGDGWAVTGRNGTQAGDFPNWSRLFPEASERQWKVDATKVASFVKQIPARNASPVRIPSAGGTLTIGWSDRSTCRDGGIIGTGDEMPETVAFNGRHLASCLAFAGGAVALTSPLKPAVCTGVAGRRALLMPVRCS